MGPSDFLANLPELSAHGQADMKAANEAMQVVANTYQKSSAQFTERDWELVRSHYNRMKRPTPRRGSFDISCEGRTFDEG